MPPQSLPRRDAPRRRQMCPRIGSMKSEPVKIFQKLGEYAALLLVWGALLALFGLLSENFLTAGTFKTLANSIPTLTVVAAGMTLVLIIGGIDLSVGSVLG